MNKTEEFGELLRCYGNMAYRMAYQITGGREAEARDLVQDGFIKAWRYWPLQRPGHFKAWMYRLLRNLYTDVLRRKARRPAVSLDGHRESERPMEETLTDSSPTTHQMLERQELQHVVACALQQLDIDFRLPVMLCDMEGLSYEEIARVMSCPVGTVRSRIHRGRSLLRTLLSQYQIGRM